ncbi:MAG: GTP-binding protein [Archangium sp.]
MATLDQQSDAVVVRIVYDGPPTAGKTTTLRALAQRLGQGQVFTPEESAGRTVYFDWMEYTGGRFEGRQIRCQIVSVPGQRALAPRRKLLLESADAVVFVADTSKERMGESLSHLDDLMVTLRSRPLSPGVVLQANKRDLPDAAPLERLRRSHGLAVVESVASAGEGTREAFVFAVRLALDRAREQMRLGELKPHDGGVNADTLLEQMKVLPLDPLAFETWAEAPRPVLQPRGSAPRLPDTSVPGGWIWPAINGRILLQEACIGVPEAARELTPGEWVADTESGWRFHSAATSVFADGEHAREALIRWAQMHASLNGWISPNRCIVLSETGDGEFRLWQVVRNEPSLWANLMTTLRTRDAENIGAKFSEAAVMCTRAAQRWSQAPYELPCTLETVGPVDGGAGFVSLMPEPDRVEAPSAMDRRARLMAQLQALLTSEFGEQHYLRDQTGTWPPFFSSAAARRPLHHPA